MNSYELSRKWFDWCFENTELITPNHTALYFFCIEHCNRLGWKKNFGLPTTMAKEAIGIRSYNTYIKTLNDLVAFGFVKMVEKSKNQYSSNIIALSNFNKAVNKALDKAFIKHATKQSESTVQSIDSIDKPITTKPLKPETIYYREFDHLKISVEEFNKLIEAEFTKEEIDSILDDIQNYRENTKYKSLYFTAKKWLKKEKSFAKKEKENNGKPESKFTAAANSATTIAAKRGWLDNPNPG